MMKVISREMGFRYFALAHHDNSTDRSVRLVRLFHYPDAVTERLVEKGLYRRDPVVRGCVSADTAFLWSDLSNLVTLDRADRETLAFGLRHGLNEGITVPLFHLGEALGSCTFAGIERPERACTYLGAAQMIGSFAFQAARRTIFGTPPPAPRHPRLHPRPRDCVVLAGRGFSNKEIARALSLTPRTVDGYLTQARRLFSAHDRTELVIKAVLAGEVGLDEVGRGQPE